MIKLNLEGESLVKLMAQESDANLELYFRCSYINPEGYIEVLHFPEMESDYLKLNPPPLVESIIFVHASNEHLLPAIYSASDGSPWYVAAFKNGMYANKINDLTKPYNLGGKKELTFFEKNAYKIAIRKLEKGELIFNTGRKGTTSRFYDYDIVYIDGKFKDKIRMGVNRGTGILGETSRGINQIEAQSQRGISGTIKTVGKIVGLFGVLADMAALLRGVAEHHIPPPSIIPPFVMMEVDKMAEDIKDFNITHWNRQLQEAIIGGRDKLEIFLNKLGGINKQYNLGFKLIDISEDLLIRLLKKEIFEYDKKSLNFETYLMNESQGKKDSSILIQSIDESDKYNRSTINHYIHAMYVNDLKI